MIGRVIGRRAVATIGVVVCVPLAGCGGGSAPSAMPLPPGSAAAGAGAGTASVRPWWHNGTGYCTVLRDTLHAGTSVFAGASSSDPAVQRTTTQFFTTVQRAAPAGLAAQWRTLGGAVVQLMSAPARRPRPDEAAVRRAAVAIAADAATRCGLNAAALAG